MTCRACADEIRLTLVNSVAASAIEHANAMAVAAGQEPFDWANELDEDDRETAKAAMRRALNVVARRFGVEEL